jgi:hypothetical protein
MGCFNRADDYTDFLFENVQTGEAYFVFMQGMTVTGYELFSPGSSWRIRGAADFNDDGSEDIVVQDLMTRSIRVVLMDGPLIVKEVFLADPDTQKVVATSEIAAVDDLNADKNGDIVWQNRTTGASEVWFTVWFPDSSLKWTSAALPTTGPDRRIKSIGHYSAVGTADILLQHRKTGEVVVWSMDGARHIGETVLVCRTTWHAGEGTDFGPALTPSLSVLCPGQVLLQNQSISSPDGRFRLTLRDGNLVLMESASRKALWTSGTNNANAAFMQYDGNLVLLDDSYQRVWATNTPRQGSYLAVQNDGNLVLYDPLDRRLWTRGRVNQTPRRNVLWPGEVLMLNQSIWSPDGRFRLTLQGDGNLVLAEQASGKVLWMSYTAGTRVLYRIVPGANVGSMQHDGNFVLYDMWTRALRATNTSGHNGAYLVLQNDGNLVLYDPMNRPLWATGTYQ